MGDLSVALTTRARRLADAATQRDWASVTALDAELNAIVRRCAADGEPARDVQAALQAVARVYERVAATVGDAHSELAARLVGLAENRHAWIAYATIAEVGQ
ncbi:putative signal transduction histidine kinase [Burkholderia thailandensis 34]|uniref:hypothetical protein n=1 Tax=Burkholderia thailandensis TaxID=57975 RepID=UPI0005D8C371|nr:hypothetical protein [Burkholderia thailandensis]AJY31525.1 putative signal transduction histidine kinase [Burkholderia thailandensis 34]AOJ58794.1 histidine kinase [Burkholderia thailandensis]KXF57913.1 histidine kinase [Burkholderia thailandensis]PNE77338.1 histidine kinase [Burkholderia thailandensis]